MPNPFERELERRAEGGQATENTSNPFQSELERRVKDDAGIMSFLQEGVYRGLDAPFQAVGALGDLVGQGMEAAGIPAIQAPAVTDFLRQPARTMAEAAGADFPTQEPDTTAEKFALGAGEAFGSLPYFLGGSAAMAKGAGTAAGVGREMVRPFIRQPGRAFAAEATAGGGFRAGEDIAENVAPDSPFARTMGGLVGSFGAAVAPGAAVRGAQSVARKTPGVGTAIRAARGAIFPFTKAGAKVRASRRLQELADDPERLAQLVERESIGGLSPAQRTGSERLMALERAVLDSDAQLDQKFKKQTAEATQALRQAIKEPGEDIPVETARQFIGKRRDYLLDLLDNRVAQAQELARQKISNLSPKRRASESARIVRDELEKALRIARQQERELWQAIPDDAMVPTTSTRQKFQETLESLGRAQQDDIPDEAKRLLSRESNQAFAEQEPVKELRALYSKLRETARKARASDDFNKARISDELADATLEDLGARGGEQSAIGRMFNTARDFSRDLNQKFRQGDIGRVLGYQREGGRSVAPDTTLDVTIGRAGTRAAVSADELRRAIGDSADAEDAMRDYLRRRFSDYASPRGQFNEGRAQDFVRQNSELLDRFPDLKTQMQDARQAQAMADRASRTLAQRADTLRNPSESTTARFLNAPVDEEIQAVLRSRNARAAVQELKRQVSKDKSGEALKGLKSGFLDHLIERAKTADIDEFGQNILSGRKLQSVLNEPRIRSATNELLNKNEMSRLNRIVTELRNLETSQRRLPNVEVMDDAPNAIISFLGRTLAARTGAQAGQGVSGASLLTAGFASQRMKNILNNLTNDQAEAMIRDAVAGDRELFAALLRRVNTPEAAKQVERRLVEWLEGYTAGQASEALNQSEEASP